MAMPNLSMTESIWVGVAPSQQQQLIFAPVGVEHAIADEAEAVADDYAELSHASTDLADGGDHCLRSRTAAHYFDEPHDVCRAEEVHPDDVVRPARGIRNGVDVERSRCSKPIPASCRQIRPSAANTCCLTARLSENSFDHEIGAFHGFDRIAALDAGEQRIRGGAAQPALHDRRVDGGMHALQTRRHGLRVGVDESHVETGGRETDRDARAHRARAEHAHRMLRDAARRWRAGLFPQKTVCRSAREALDCRQCSKRVRERAIPASKPSFARGLDALDDGIAGLDAGKLAHRERPLLLDQGGIGHTARHQPIAQPTRTRARCEEFRRIGQRVRR